jgi:alkylation response protein AidB-like acyl-CoA dehydrogenase
MTTLSHPSTYISTDATTIIRNTSRGAELLGSLHPEQLGIIYTQNWFNLFVPKALGGLELSLPEALNIEEGLAYADGSTGWTVTLCSGANWFAGFLQPEIAAAIFSNKKVCLAGSGQPGGTAKVIPSGYEITGHWKYATGAPHATAFTANCIIEKDGVALQNEDGSPVMRSFIFLKEEVFIYNDWHTTGMVATASHSFEVNKLQVPANRCFSIGASTAVLNNAVYQYPFLQFAEATLTVNLSGMAVRFVDLCEILFAERIKRKNLRYTMTDALQQKLNAAKQQLHSARQQFYNSIQQSWHACLSGNAADELLFGQVSTASRVLTLTALQSVDALYPFAGLAAADSRTEINRVWRNLHTASQHSLLTTL